MIRARIGRPGRISRQRLCLACGTSHISLDCPPRSKRRLGDLRADVCVASRRGSSARAEAPAGAPRPRRRETGTSSVARIGRRPVASQDMLNTQVGSKHRRKGLRHVDLGPAERCTPTIVPWVGNAPSVTTPQTSRSVDAATSAAVPPRLTPNRPKPAGS